MSDLDTVNPLFGGMPHLSTEEGLTLSDFFGMAVAGFFRQFLAADYRQVHADLYGNRGAADVDCGFAVQIPAQRAGGKFLDVGLQWNAVHGDAYRLGLRAKMRTADRARGLGCHWILP